MSSNPRTGARPSEADAAGAAPGGAVSDPAQWSAEIRGLAEVDSQADVPLEDYPAEEGALVSLPARATPARGTSAMPPRATTGEPSIESLIYSLGRSGSSLPAQDVRALPAGRRAPAAGSDGSARWGRIAGVAGAATALLVVLALLWRSQQALVPAAPLPIPPPPAPAEALRTPAVAPPVEVIVPPAASPSIQPPRPAAPGATAPLRAGAAAVRPAAGGAAVRPAAPAPPTDPPATPAPESAPTVAAALPTPALPPAVGEVVLNTPAPPGPEAVPPGAAAAAEAAAAADAARRAAIDRVLKAYEQSFDRRDVSAVAAAWRGANTKELSRAFKSVRSQDLSFDRCDIIVADSRAIARCSGVVHDVPRAGRATPRTRRVNWVIEVVDSGDRWMIEHVTATDVR